MHFYYYYVEDTAEIRTCISYVVERNTAANTILPSVNCVTTKMGFSQFRAEGFSKISPTMKCLVHSSHCRNDAKILMDRSVFCVTLLSPFLGLLLRILKNTHHWLLVCIANVGENCKCQVPPFPRRNSFSQSTYQGRAYIRKKIQ